MDTSARPGSGQGYRALSPPTARRLATARQRVSKAKGLGPKETIEALRASLLAAVKINPSQAILDEVADFVLAKIHELYTDADRSDAGT